MDITQNSWGGILRTRRILNYTALLCAMLFAQTAAARDFESVLPGVTKEIKSTAFSSENYYYYHKAKPGEEPVWTITIPAQFRAAADTLLKKQHTTLVEMLSVIEEGKEQRQTTLDIYNALGKTNALAGRKYYSHVRRRLTPLFKTVSRVESEKSSKKIPDPLPKTVLPAHETIYIIVDDSNFGSCHYRADFSLLSPGIVYEISNTQNISFLLWPVIKKDLLHMFFYIEPVDEGVLIYALMGVTMDEGGSYVDAPSAARKRLDVIKGWLIDGITGKI